MSKPETAQVAKPVAAQPPPAPLLKSRRLGDPLPFMVTDARLRNDTRKREWERSASR